MINELLSEKNISIYRLSKLSGVPYSTISDIASGRTPITSVTSSTLAALSKALGVSMERLYYGKQEEHTIYLYNVGREIHIVFEDLHFRFMGPKNLIAFKSVNRISEGCAHVNTYFSDKKVIYLEEEYVDIRGEFEEYDYLSRYPETFILKLEKPGEENTTHYSDEALMICENMAFLRHDSSVGDVEIEVINMARQNARMIMRLKDYAILASSMSDTMQKKVIAITRRNEDLIATLSEEDRNGGAYA